MKLLFIGDIIGKPGRSALKALLPGLLAAHRAEAVIINGENSAAGFGITEGVGHELFSLGVHVITTGNHVWDKHEAVSYLAREPRVIRPLNYPPGVPGNGSHVFTAASSGARICVLNLAGRVFMHSLDCPFRTTEAELERLKGQADFYLIDLHAEATSEKIAFGRYFDGRVGAVLGTHTHVQTADERILPGGTAYITDAGMSGPVDSVIGVEEGRIFKRFLTQMPVRFDVAAGPVLLCGVVVGFDPSTGRATSIERFQLPHPA